MSDRSSRSRRDCGNLEAALMGYNSAFDALCRSRRDCGNLEAVVLLRRESPSAKKPQSPRLRQS